MSPNRKLSDRRAKQETPKEKSSEPEEKIEWPKSEKRGAEEKNNEPEEKIERPKSEKRNAKENIERLKSEKRDAEEKNSAACTPRISTLYLEAHCTMHNATLASNFDGLDWSTLHYSQCRVPFKYVGLCTMSRLLQGCFFFGWEHIKLFTMSCLQTTTQVTSIHEINNIVMQKLFKAYAYTLFYSYHIQIQF